MSVREDEAVDPSAEASSAAERADAALQAVCDQAGVDGPADLDWPLYERATAAMGRALGDWPPHRRFLCEQPAWLEDPVNGRGRGYLVSLAYTDPGGQNPVAIAVGGITNVARRFDFLAHDARPDVRVVALDLPGRGRSGWMAEIAEYNPETYLHQVKSLIAHLECAPCTLVGSSLGGSLAIRLAARHPELVDRIVLNDASPYIPRERRQRRARAAPRHYVFRTPSEFFRGTGASAKHVGPVPDAVILHSAHHKTVWSDVDDGRVYSHDPRALLAFRDEAGESLDLWDTWADVRCPVLLVHGCESDATSAETVERMRAHGDVSVLHVPRTGHTPPLSDFALNRAIAEWITTPRPAATERIITPTLLRSRRLYPIP